MEMSFLNTMDNFYNERNCYQDPFIYESQAEFRSNSFQNFSSDCEGTLQTQDQLISSFYGTFPENLTDPLDDIDPETLFYQKSFTELIPVRCNISALEMLYPPQPLESNFCEGFPGGGELPLNQKIDQLDKENIYPFINQNYFHDPDFNNKFLPFSRQDFGPEVIDSTDLPTFESCADPQVNFQDDFDLLLLNTSPYPLTSEYINFDAPVYEGENERFETDSNVSSSDSCSSTHEGFHQDSPTKEFGEHSWVKEIKVGKNNRPRGPKCWEFLLRLLRDSASNPSLVKWENPELGSFKLVEKDKISAIWGNRPSKKKNGKVIKYESFARILRYHYKKGSGMVLPVSEKHLVYKFASKVMAAYRAGKIL